MSRKEPQFQDRFRAELNNEIGEVSLAGKVLEDADKFYVITEVVASGAATATIINGRGEEQQKTIDAGRTIYFHPIAGRKITFSATVTEYWGYFLRTPEPKHLTP